MNSFLLLLAGALPDVKVDQEEEPVPSNTTGGETILMNNGSRDTSHSDIQKLQQQLQDIKEQVRKFIHKKSTKNTILNFISFSFRQCVQFAWTA